MSSSFFTVLRRVSHGLRRGGCLGQITIHGESSSSSMEADSKNASPNSFLRTLEVTFLFTVFSNSSTGKPLSISSPKNAPVLYLLMLTFPLASHRISMSWNASTIGVDLLKVWSSADCNFHLLVVQQTRDLHPLLETPYSPPLYFSASSRRPSTIFSPVIIYNGPSYTVRFKWLAALLLWTAFLASSSLGMNHSVCVCLKEYLSTALRSYLTLASAPSPNKSRNGNLAVPCHPFRTTRRQCSHL